mgnify:CR=1 FL=1
MANLDMWVHYAPQILNQGRTTHLEGKPNGEEEVEPADLLAREVKKDPWEPRLKSIVNDDKTIGGMPAWILRSYNCKDNLKDVKSGLKTVNHGTVVLKSLWWPGQNVFYNNGRV